MLFLEIRLLTISSDFLSFLRYLIKSFWATTSFSVALISLSLLLRYVFSNICNLNQLLSEEAMIASKEFMTSVVVGKDVVPRIGMHQLETLRYGKVVDILVILGMTWI